MRILLGLAFVLLLRITCAGIAQAQSSSTERTGVRSQAVFVCDHGAALSVVAAAYFNKLAREQHLNLHAIARGTKPQKNISVSARDGLKADGVPSGLKRPRALSQQDAIHALRIVAFCPLPRKYSHLAPVETWSDVPATSANYPLARDAILKHLRELVGQLKMDSSKP
jgi:arsenate reductase (thioredoxin)